MKYILIALALSFTSCTTNEPSTKGKLTNFTVSDGKASFKLDEVQYKNVTVLSESATTMGNSCGQEVEVVMSNGEITSVYTKVTNTFWKYTAYFIGGCLLLTILIGVFSANDDTNQRYSANRGSNWQDEIKY